jgi:hypothetical protein
VRQSDEVGEPFFELGEFLPEGKVAGFDQRSNVIQVGFNVSELLLEI